jgi:hypothetical protein
MGGGGHTSRQTRHMLHLISRGTKLFLSIEVSRSNTARCLHAGPLKKRGFFVTAARVAQSVQ